MTYGGIYRDVYLDIKEDKYIEDVFIKTKKDKINLCKKILEGNLYIAYNAGIPLMDFGKLINKKVANKSKGIYY